MVFLKCLLLLHAVLFCCLFHPAESVAGEPASLLTATLLVSEAYDDNVYYNSNNKIDDYYTCVQPGLELDHKTGTTSTTIQGQWVGYFYSQETERDHIHHSYTLDHEYKPTYYSGLTLNGLLKKASTLGSEYRGSGRDRYDRDYFSITPGYYRDMTRNLMLDFNFTYAEETFEDSAYPDYEFNQAEIGITRRLSKPGASLFLRTGYKTYDYEAEPRQTQSGILTTIEDVVEHIIDQYDVWLGLEYPLTQTVTFNAWAGGRYSQSEYKARVQQFAGPFFAGQYIIDDETSGWDTITFASLKKAWTENSTATLAFARQYGPSVYGSVTETNQIDLDLMYQSLLFIIDVAGYYKTEKEEGDVVGNRKDQDTWSISSALTWRTGENTWLKAHYQYQTTDYNFTHDSASRNTIWLGFLVGYDLLALF